MTPFFLVPHGSAIRNQNWASLTSPWVKNPPAMQEMEEMEEIRVGSLGWEDPLEEEMATHSSILAWRIPWTEEPGRYSPWGHKQLGRTEQRSGSSSGDTARPKAGSEFGPLN